MSSKTADPVMHSAAWRISAWATLAYTCGTMLVFVSLQGFVANDIQRRSDAWLSGEVEVLGDVAEITPKDALYDRVVGEVAELASREVPNRDSSESAANDSVFFLELDKQNTIRLWVGPGSVDPVFLAIGKSVILPGNPRDIKVQGFAIPFRVAAAHLEDGSTIYLGLSERDQRRVLKNLRIRFFLFWLLLVLLGFAIVYSTTRQMLSHVRKMTEAASRIGHSDLSDRVPVSNRRDEVSQLARTLNHMLDRIEESMYQLHTITDALAHDLRSPLTAIRGKLEMSLSTNSEGERFESIVASIEELDRLNEFLNASLDVAEAKAGALRICKEQIDLNEMLRTMIDLYGPSMAEQGLGISMESPSPALIDADASLLHRMIANLFDNEIKHLPESCQINIRVATGAGEAQLVVEDDGPGFAANVLDHLFERRVKGKESRGHGLGLAFVDAVARAHGGGAFACNRDEGGARIVVHLPLWISGHPGV
jgi:signal transduction histidine kinase